MVIDKFKSWLKQGHLTVFLAFLEISANVLIYSDTMTEHPSVSMYIIFKI